MTTPLRYIQSGERMVGDGHATFDDTLNRALKDFLASSGYDPNANFPGMYAPVYNLLASRPNKSVDIGDGVNDPTTIFQDAADATPEGCILYVPTPSNFYALTDEITFSKRIIIRGDRSHIKQTTAGKRGFVFPSSVVNGLEIYGLELEGPQFAAFNNTETGLDFIGTAGSPLQGIKVRFCNIHSWGRGGVQLYNCQKFAIEQNDVYDSIYLGIMALSCQNGRICLNDIDNITGDVPNIGNVNSYGIVLTRHETDSLAVGPHQTDILVALNSISNVTIWHALDTHGGRRLKFINNLIRNCATGVSLGPCQDVDNVTELYAPIDCIVRGNDMDSGVTDGTAEPGINMVGAASGVAGTSNEESVGNMVTDNLIRGYGNEVTSTLNGAIWARNTRGLVLARNTIIEPNSKGISFYHDNKDFYCKDNLIIDVWNGGAIGTADAIAFTSSYNTGLLEGNKLIHHTKSAAVLNGRGFVSTISTGCDLFERDNNFRIATIPYDAGANQTTYLDAETIDGFFVDNVAGTVGDTEVLRFGNIANRWRPSRPGSIVGILISATEARTAGSLTVKSFKNTGLSGAAGSQLGTSINTLDSSHLSERLIPVPRGEQAFAAFDEVYATYSTASWTPTSSDLRVALLVVYD